MRIATTVSGILMNVMCDNMVFYRIGAWPHSSFITRVSTSLLITTQEPLKISSPNKPLLYTERRKKLQLMHSIQINTDNSTTNDTKRLSYY